MTLEPKDFPLLMGGESGLAQTSITAAGYARTVANFVRTVADYKSGLAPSQATAADHRGTLACTTAGETEKTAAEPLTY